MSEVSNLRNSDKEPVWEKTVDEKHRRRLLRHIALRIRNLHDSEDLVQTVYLKMLERPAQVLRNPNGYLYQIAHNVICNFFKTKKRERDCVTFSTAMAQLAAEAPSRELLSSVEPQYSYNDIEAQVSSLRKEIGDVMRLSCEQLLTVEQVAEQMGLARATVVKYRTKGKQQLWELLKEP